VAHVSHVLPDGRVLLDDASFKVPDGAIAAIVGPNGAGKTTLLRMLAGDVAPAEGTVAVSGGLGVMRQFIGAPQAAGTTVRDLLLSVSPQQVQAAARTSTTPSSR
jgi:ABC-type multidrug transport system ATPase subunit